MWSVAPVNEDVIEIYGELHLACLQDSHGNAHGARISHIHTLLFTKKRRHMQIDGLFLFVAVRMLEDQGI